MPCTTKKDEVGHFSVSSDIDHVLTTRELARMTRACNVAIYNEIAASQRMLQTEDWRDDCVTIEVMACVGGCLGSGDETKSMDPHILEQLLFTRKDFICSDKKHQNHSITT